MATFLILGTYTNKGAKGLVEKNSDRREAMKTLADSVGAKWKELNLLISDRFISSGNGEFNL